MTQRELRLPIRSEMDVNKAVLEAGRFAKECGFGQAPGLMIATAVSELARNVLRHGGGRGELRLRRVEGRRSPGVRVEVSDSGPGIVDVERALEDHFSSVGTLGLGLPGVKRMMDEFEIESEPGKGTRVTACKWIVS